jgi:hypothetical protein
MFQQDAQKILGLLEIGDPQVTIGDLIPLYNFGFGGTPYLRKPPYIVNISHFKQTTCSNIFP